MSPQNRIIEPEEVAALLVAGIGGGTRNKRSGDQCRRRECDGLESFGFRVLSFEF